MSISARYDEVTYAYDVAAHAALAETMTAVGDQLGRLATLVGRLDQALDTVRALGATSVVAPTAPAASATWSLRRDGEGWVLDAGEEHGRFGGFRGFDHLHTMLANPHRDVAASELDGGNTPLLRGLPTLDESALVVYRRRLAEIMAEIESADHVGDQERSVVLEEERSRLLAELRRATGLGCRIRTTSDAGERARVNVTRNIKRALERIQRATPVAGWHLAASIRTGTHCRYDPRPDGPERWVLTPTGATNSGGTSCSAGRNAPDVSASPSLAPRRIR